MRFEPVAVTGMGCLLPGAEDPEALWQAILAGRDLITEPPPGRSGIARLLARSGDAPGPVLSERGGYVRESPAALRSLANEPLLAGLDPGFGWMVYAARQALSDAGYPGRAPRGLRTGAIFGNLSFPTPALTRLAEWVWLARQDPDARRALGLDDLTRLLGPEPDARNRFVAGLPARILTKTLGLDAGAFALDAACASSLYAARLAVERLWSHDADVMLAGGINGTDALFLHKGFGHLGAKSPTGQSRPFHRDADGLVPSEGAAFVVLRRLEDAIAQGERILGVIRGIGLSNDGGMRGRLTPDPDGQVRAMMSAYAMSGLRPSDLGFVECHATGTPVGDRTEAASLAQVFSGHPALAIGSLKANLGHTVTAAGAAGMIKVLMAMRHDTLPPGRHSEAPIDAVGTAGFRLLRRSEPWTGEDRYAAVSAFGFGGANAHLILEAWHSNKAARRSFGLSRTSGPGADGSGQRAAARPADVGIAVVGIGVIVADRVGTQAVARALQEGSSHLRRTPDGTYGGVADAVSVDIRDLHLPPGDLALVAPRDLAMFVAAREALQAAGPFDAGRTVVIVGTEAQTAPARHVARVHANEWLQTDENPEGAGVPDAFAPVADAPTIAGILPNMTANLLNGAFRITGPGYTVSSGVTSGLTALQEGIRALSGGEVDTVLVGAADLSCEPVHAAALARLAEGHVVPGDAAVALVLRRLPDAVRRRDRMYATIRPEERVGVDLRFGDGPDALNLGPRFGQSYAASGLFHVAAAALALFHGLRPEGAACVQRDGTPERSAAVSLSDGSQGLFTFTLTRQSAPEPLPESAGTDDSVPAAPGTRLTLALHDPPVVLPLPGRDAVPHGHPDPDAVGRGGRVPAAADAHYGPEPEWMAPAPALPGTEARLLPIPSVPSVPSAPSPMPVPVATQETGPAGRVPIAHPIAEAHLNYLARAREGHDAYLAAMTTYARALTANLRDSLRAPGTASPAKAATPPPPAEGTVFDRATLERHAKGLASSVFGPDFQPIDGVRRVRMPGPPMLLVDRVTALRAMPRSMGQGTVVTETRVDPAGWYMHDGSMTAGALIEAGQADLFLISYLGIDFLTGGERVYRLLGCDLTFHDTAARSGDLLSYEITIDDHARQGDVRLFFFHYDALRNGRPLITMRNGQAGFFTDEELERTPGGLWTPAALPRRTGARVDRPRAARVPRSLDKEQVLAFSRGDLRGAFGDAFRLAATQVRPPRIPSGPLLLIDEVPELDPAGGPYGNGYMRAVTQVRGDEWFFQDHFFQDPVMPGTLMFEGCLQAMSLYLAALGMSLDTDGWRFAPAAERPFRMSCRGQVTAAPHRLTYELYVEELVDSPRPSLTADVVVHVDGVQAFHCRALSVALTPDWPITNARELASVDLDTTDPEVLHLAWGQPSKTLGEAYRPFDAERSAPRLPGPPYLFISRFAFHGPRGGMEVGSRVEAEFDVRPDAWYFPDGEGAVMPLAALVEVGLQPCGALSAHIGVPLTSDQDVHIRNLDGDLRILGTVPRRKGTLRTVATVTSLSRMGTTTIEAYRVTISLDDAPVAELTSVFGHFTETALAEQTGFGRRDEGTKGPDERRAEPLRVPPSPLSMPGRLLLWDPDGGSRGLGCLTSRMDVDPGAWFFRAHFYQDPVQPGSLGVEAMVDLVKEYLVRQHVPTADAPPVFRTLAPDSLSWQYRGQVTAHSRQVDVEIEITETGEDAMGPYAWADGRLWVDGLCIYRARHLGVALKAVPEATAPALRDSWLGPPDRGGAWIIDPGRAAWLSDHSPTFTRPVLPMTGMIDLLAQAALARMPETVVVGLRRVEAHKWLFVDRTVRISTAVTEVGTEEGTKHLRIEAFTSDASPESAGADPALFLRGEVVLADSYPVPDEEALEALEAPSVTADPYEDGAMFHGPAFHVIERLTVGTNGATAVLRADKGEVAPGVLGPVVLDGIAQSVGGDLPRLRMADWPAGIVAFPVSIPEIRLFGPIPVTGELTGEIRRMPGEPLVAGAIVPFKAQLFQEDVLYATMRLDMRLLPIGSLAELSPADRRAYLTGERYVPAGHIASIHDGEALLTNLDVVRMDWLPGTLGHVYRTEARGRDLTREIALKDLVANRAEVPPGTVRLPQGDGEARVEGQPFGVYPVSAQEIPGGIRARLEGPATLDLTAVSAYVTRRTGIRGFLMTDVWCAIVAHTVRQFVLTDPHAFATAGKGPMLFLANHQTAIESISGAILLSALTERDITSVAKSEHRDSWIGQLATLAAAYPGVSLPRPMLFLDQTRPEAMLDLLREAGAALGRDWASLLVHVEGARALSARHRIQAMSGTWIDLALTQGVPIVPVRFAGGLPVRPLTDRLETAWRFARQDIFVGSPLTPDRLRALPYAKRIRCVIDAIEAIGPAPEAETPNPPDPGLERAVAETARGHGRDPVSAAIAAFLRRWPHPGPETACLMTAGPDGPAPLYGGDARDAWLRRAGALLDGRLPKGGTK